MKLDTIAGPVGHTRITKCKISKGKSMTLIFLSESNLFVEINKLVANSNMFLLQIRK